MALNQSIQVPLPDKKIVKHKIKEAVYAYYVVRTYRNAVGKPTNDRVVQASLFQSYAQNVLLIKYIKVIQPSYRIPLRLNRSIPAYSKYYVLVVMRRYFISNW